VVALLDKKLKKKIEGVLNPEEMSKIDFLWMTKA